MIRNAVMVLSIMLFVQPVWAQVILTSIKPIQMIVQELTLEDEPPQVLLSASASPHDYALRPSDVKKIQQADLVIWFGFELESFLAKPLATHAQVLTLSQIKPLSLRAYDKHEDHEDDEHDHDHHHGSHDVHFWLGIEQSGQAAQAITERLMALNPEKAHLYQAKLAIFLEKLAEVDQQIAQQLSQVSDQAYYVFHDAYGYFEKRYALRHLGAFTLNPERKPGAKSLLSIHQALKNNQVTCVFSEPQFTPAIIDSVTRGSQVKIGQLDPLGSQIKVQSGSYFTFLTDLAQQFYQCLAP